MKRGELTKEIKDKSKQVFGYEFCKNELRLLPYIQYRLTNTQTINPEHIDKKDKEILSKYVKKGFITDGVNESGRPQISEGSILEVTKEFWDKMVEMIWYSYVIYDEK